MVWFGLEVDHRERGHSSNGFSLRDVVPKVWKPLVRPGKLSCLGPPEHCLQQS